MEKTGQSYSSGEWSVQAGREEEFIERWTTFIEWSLDNARGAESFVLVQSMEESSKFLSLGAWENQEAQEAWRGMPRMQELLGQCRELCEEFEFHPYTLADTIPRCHLLAQKYSPKASPTPSSSSSRRAATTPLPKSRRSSGRRFATSSGLRSHPTAPRLWTRRPRDGFRLRLAYFD